MYGSAASLAAGLRPLGNQRFGEKIKCMDLNLAEQTQAGLPHAEKRFSFSSLGLENVG